MPSRRTVLAAGAVAVAAASLALLGSAGAGSDVPRAAAAPAADRTLVCANQSKADFPGAFRRGANLVVGPLALMGGRTYTDAETARRFGGNKFPLLVRAGHRVTVRLPASARGYAGLAYGPFPDGKLALRDAYDSIAFVACPRDRTQSTADGARVTFWSGFVMTSRPACVPLDVFADGAATARRVHIELGRRCARAAAPPPLRDCASRAENGMGPPQVTSRPGDVVIGPIAFAGLQRVASRRGLEHFKDRRGYAIKAGAGVLAGVRATVTIGRSAHSWAKLSFAPHVPGKPHRDVAAVRFQACAADEPAFSYDGPVGPVTGFAGGFALKRRGCVPLEVRVAGRPAIGVRVPFGVGRCAQQA
jgi:hypothetical protein